MRHHFCLGGVIFAILCFATTMYGAELTSNVGVGLVLKSGEDGSVWIVQVVPNSPAERGGVKAGDQLLEVDDIEVNDMKVDDVTLIVRGPEGSNVALKVESRGQEARKLTLRRESFSAQAAPNPGAASGAVGNPLTGSGNAPAQSQQQPAGQAAPSSVMRFVRVSVHDPEINNIEACSILVPQGWRYRLGVVWDPNTIVQANLQFGVTDPQSGAQAEFLPLQYYIFAPNDPMHPRGSNYMGAIVCEPITDLEQFARVAYGTGALSELRSARRVAVEEMPKIAATVQQACGDPNQAKSGRVRFVYNVNGQPWEEDVYLTLIYSPAQGMVMWQVYSASVVRAPQGQLDRVTPLMTSILYTTRLNQDWFCGLMYVRDLFHKRMMGGIQDAGILSQQISQNSEEIRRMFSDSYKTANETEDRISQSFSETTRGVNTYANPYEGRPVELPSGYNDAWANSKGEYILSNQAGYDPNVGATTEWRRMNQRGENGQ
jgi:hypothetical protein